MAKTYTDSGIILKRWNYKERDRMVRVLAASKGKITCRLISGKKLTSKLAGNCEPFMIADFFFAQSKTIDILAGSVPTETLSNLRTDPYRYACAGFFSELIDRLTEDNDPEPAVYEYVLSVFRIFHEEPAHVLMLTAAALQLFVLLGYHPELRNCVVCRNPIREEQGNQWNMAIWGVQCPRCVSQDATIRVSISSIKIIRFLLEHDVRASKSMKLSEAEWTESFAVILAMVHYLVGQELLSERVLLGLNWSRHSRMT
ncbi:MAG: DNA repair protein RecO [Candidatus Kerfeldbacteria bacterium]|nr:DNA repair protein RecO [Candidatus Kerfeldbacteria bacterium]